MNVLRQCYIAVSRLHGARGPFDSFQDANEWIVAHEKICVPSSQANAFAVMHAVRVAVEQTPPLAVREWPIGEAMALCLERMDSSTPKIANRWTVIYGILRALEDDGRQFLIVPGDSIGSPIHDQVLSRL